MKKMKKMMALVIAMVMVLAMGTAVFAAEDRTTENDGVVKVTNANADYNYTLYLLFKADMGANDAITYTTNIDLTGNEWFELNSNGFVVAKDGVEDDWAKDPDAIAWVKANGTKISTKSGAEAKNPGWTGLEYGYYFVDTSMGAFVGVDSANKTAEILEKNSEPGVDKEIVSTTNGVVGDEPANASQADKGKNEAATAQVGDTVNYKVTVTAEPGAENYVVKDTLSAGLTAPAASAVTVTDATVTTDYTVDVTGQVITVTFTKAYLDKIKTETEIVINYSAVVNSNAVIGEAGNPNTVTLDYGHDPTDESKPGKTTPPDEAKVYVAKITVIKKDGSSNGLAGATFALKNADGKYYKFTAAAGTEPAKVEWVEAVANATTFTSKADGTLDGEFTGLPNGEYTLEETVAPEGYNEIAPTDSSLKFTIADKDYTNENLIQETTVINQAGSVLPSTGGIGTTIFYIIGAILVIGAGVLLVTRRRVNAN